MSLTELLQELAPRIAEADRAAIPAVIGQLETLKAQAWALLASPPPASADDKSLLDIKQTAEWLNLPESSVYELARCHGGLPFKRIGKHLRISKRDLRVWWATLQEKGLDAKLCHRHNRRRDDRTRPSETEKSSRSDARRAGGEAGRPLEHGGAMGAGRA